MKNFEKINPAIKANSLMMLLTMLTPQLFLTLFRLRDLWMIRNEITEHRDLIYINYLLLPLVLSGLALAMILWSRKTGRDLPRRPMLGFFLIETASLVTYLMSLEHLIPEGVDAWILPIGTFIMLQLAATMPGLLYALICICNIKWFNNTLINIGSSFAILLGAPGLLFIIGNSFPIWKAPELFVITLFVFGTLVAAYAFVQLLLWLSGKMSNGWIATLLFALLLPVAGLLLNHRIPFPADLQHWGFYALTVANGLILLTGSHPAAKGKVYSAIASSFSYPFTCYFFFLFLPFLPFSILAMIAVGAGFLILTPTLLFIIHTRQLILQFNALKARWSPLRLVTGFLIAFLLVPAAYVGRALVHKHIFFETLDRVYASSFDTPAPLPSPRTAAYALQKLKDTKNGIYIPILTESYNRIVFGGMVLPDRNIRQLEKLLLTEEEDWKARDEMAFYSFFTGRSARTNRRWSRPPARNVALMSIDCTSEEMENQVEATVLLTMKNNVVRQSEYVADITLPDGVFVSGYELKIEDEMVPGRLSDRKAAMWVYHMIRDRARRDPGLVVYTGPNRLRLNVFPFASNEERQCAFRFLYPAGLSPEINIDGRTVSLPGHEPAITQVQTAEGRTALYIPPSRSKELPGTFRTVEKVALNGTDATPGYCPEWDIKRSLLNYWSSGEKQLNTVPWFVTETDQPIVHFDRAAYWLPLNPDGGWSGTPPAKREVLPLQCGTSVRAIPKTQGGLAIFDQAAPITLQGAPLKADTQLGPDTRYAKAIDLWQQWWQTQLHPEQEEQLRKQLLLTARELNILIPSTAFLAVESNAQNEALKKAEKKSLKGHSTLAFDEFEESKSMDSPEPAFLFIMLVILPLFHWIYLKRRKQDHAS